MLSFLFQNLLDPHFTSNRLFPYQSCHEPLVTLELHAKYFIPELDQLP